LIDLSLAGGVLSVEISDNGCGMSPEDLSKAKSFGIRGLRERADMVDGWVDFSSDAGGTTVILSVPVTARGQRDADSVFGETGFGRDNHDPSSWGSSQ
jgi:glucose-6-phosphate-specific signal transduction histidine kinase